MSSATNPKPQHSSPSDSTPAANDAAANYDDENTTEVPVVPLLRGDIEDAPFWKEVAAFNQLPNTVVDEYYGRYIAVYQGNIVDSDTDEGELALRFYRTFGYVPVYIHKVGTEDGLVDTDNI
jgi:hypothetical protein